MKGYLSGMVLLFPFGYVAATQSEIKSIEHRCPGNTEIQYHLPRFSPTDDPKVAKRINDYTFTSPINRLPSNTPQATVNQFAKLVMNSTTNLDYTVEYCDARILTTSMSIEDYGAYCESYNVPISFDLASDAIVALNDLFSRITIAGLNTRTRKEIHGQIDTFVTAHNS